MQLPENQTYRIYIKRYQDSQEKSINALFIFICTKPKALYVRLTKCAEVNYHLI